MRWWLSIPLVFSAIPLSATAFTQFRVDDLSYGAVALSWNVADSTFSQTVSIDGGTSTVMTHTIADASSASNGAMFRTLYAALGNDTWYYLITFGSNTFTCENDCGGDFCDSTDSSLFADDNGVNANANSGLKCGGAAEPPYIVHPASATINPADPVHASTDPYSFFDGVGETLTEVETNCADLKSDYSAQVAAGGAGEVLLLSVTDYAQPCRISSWAPASHNWDYIVIQPKLDESLYLTPFARASVVHSTAMLILEHQNPTQRESLGSAIFITPNERTIFRQTWIRDPLEIMEPTTYTVIDATASTRHITIAEACPSPAIFQGMMLNLPGFTAYPGYATINSCSGGVIQFTSGSGTFTGSLTSNGTATIGSHIPIASCTATDPIQCTTTVNHGLPDPSTADVRQDFVYVGQVNGVNANGTRKFTIVDSDTFELTGSLGSTGTFTTSPLAFVRYGSMSRRSLIHSSGNDDVWVLQSIIGSPWYGQFQAAHSVGMSGDRNGFRDGFIHGGGQGFPLDPDDGLPERWYTPTIGLDTFRIDGCRDCQFRNVGVSGGLMTAHFNAQNFARQPTDITIEAVEIATLKRNFTGSNFEPYSLGLYSTDPRQCIEMKGGIERMKVVGLTCDGSATALDFNSTQYAYFFSNTVLADQDTETRHVRDIDIQWSITRGYGTPLGIGTQVGGLVKNHGINGDVSFTNNWHFGDSLHAGIVPQNPITPGLAASNAGYQMSIRSGVYGFDYRNNTNWYNNGANGEYIVVYGGDRIPRCVIEDNIFIYYGGNPVVNSIGGTPFSPLDATSFQTRFDSFCPGGSFQNNLVLRGTENPADIPTQEVLDTDAANKTQTEWDAAWATTGSFAGVTAGPDLDTFAARHQAVFPGGSMVTQSSDTYANYGVSSYDTLRRMRGKVTADNNAVIQTDTDTLQFSWDSCSTDGGTVRVSSNSFTTNAISSTSASGFYPQTVTLSGLSEGATYEAFVENPGCETLYWRGTLQ